MNNNPLYFDLILVLEYFRSTPSFLSIIKYLSNNYRIGLFKTPLHASQLNKNDEVQASFEAECVRMGGIFLSTESVETFEAKIVIIPQRLYSKEAIYLIKCKIKAQRTMAAMGLAWAGVEKTEKFLDELSIKELLVIDLNFTNYLLHKRGKEKHYHDYILHEVGLPFEKYPYFNSPIADYIIAMPTEFSFSEKKDKIQFLKSLIRLMSLIPKNKKFLYKPHNGLKHDSFLKKQDVFLGIISLFVNFLRLNLLLKYCSNKKIQYLANSLEFGQLCIALYFKTRKHRIPKNLS